MSKYKTVLTQLKDKVAIVEAIEQCCPELQGKVFAEGGVIQGDTTEEVDIIIRRGDMNGKNASHGYADMGLKQQADGTFTWVISYCDQGNYEMTNDPATGERVPNPNGHYNATYGMYGQEFQNEVESAATLNTGLYEAEQVGWQATGEATQCEDDQFGNGWSVPIEIDEADLNRMGVYLPN